MPKQALRRLGRPLLAFAGGALALLAFAPWSLYPLAFAGTALLLALWRTATPRQAFFEGYAFGLGLLGFGVFWVHISIDQFGNVGTLLAILITLLFIASMALYYGLAGWLALRLAGDRACSGPALLLFCSLLLSAEWLRGWLFGGFPWLALGYSQIDGPLGAWAPVLGVYGVSWLVYLSAALVISLVLTGRWRLVALGGLVLIWGGALLLEGHPWTQPAGRSLQVAIVQGNVPQALKWRREMRQPTLQRYLGLTRGQWDKDLVVWPETAVPALADQVEASLLAPLEREVQAHGRSLLLGVPVREQGRYYNSMLSLGASRGRYDKRHLVPFGEFMPLKGLLQPLVDWLNIPMSDFSAGRAAKPLLQLAGYPAGISICYEDAFGEEVIEALPEAAFLVNASNDAWFGDSLALHQHLEIARMRARESGRYLLRATNTGISALIDQRGALLARSPLNRQFVLEGELVPMQGMTPYARFGNRGVLLLAGLGALLALCLLRCSGATARRTAG